MNSYCFQVDIVTISNTGLVRENNEDFYGVSNKLNEVICVVCDGMGGHNYGEVASKIAVKNIISFFEDAERIDINLALMQAYESTNQSILNEAKSNSLFLGMGTTACSLILKNNEVWIAHIGDSRIYLFTKRKRELNRLTKDHSLVQSLLDEGIITEEEALNHHAKHTIIKALGIKDNIAAEVSTIPIKPSKGDIFLLCTDGLHGEISDKVIEKILKKRVSLRRKSNQLLQAALKAGGHDNITFQLVKIK